jgi:hypothetical protein
MKRPLNSFTKPIEKLVYDRQGGLCLLGKERSGSMRKKEVLQKLELGNSVAEFDNDLKSYFVETETFRLLKGGHKDIVAGDKGTGKTALFRILRERYKTIPEMNQVEVVPAFNTTGSPVFQQLTEGAVFTEGQYRTIWKAYVLSLAGNWLLDVPTKCKRVGLRLPY